MKITETFVVYNTLKEEFLTIHTSSLMAFKTKAALDSALNLESHNSTYKVFTFQEALDRRITHENYCAKFERYDG